MTRVAIIPARGGSKRIPRKNIKTFCGKPMIAWPIESAQKSGCFDRIIVSTDDYEIGNVAAHWGAELPFMRPTNLADEYTGTIPVIRHAVEWLEKNDYKPEQVCCIYATAPFLSPEDIHLGLKKLELSGSEYAFSVTTFEFPIQRAIRITGDDRVEMFYPEYFEVRSQDLEEAWHDAGQFYWGKADAWQRGEPLFTPLSTPVPIPRHRVQDIDTIEDWKRAELMHKVLNQAGGLA